MVLDNNHLNVKASGNVLISIVTPAFNEEHHIEEMIQCVINQSFTDWELIIVDNRSTDNTISIVNKFIQSDSRIKLEMSEKGAAKARQKGIEIAVGKYIAFLDADDLWHKDKLNQQYKFMEESNVVFSYHPYAYIDELSNEIGVVRNVPAKITYESQLRGNRIGCLSVMYLKDSAANTAIPNLLKRNDAALWLRILKEVKVGHRLDLNLGFYRLSNNSLSSGSKLKLLKHHFKMYRESEKFSLFKSIYYVLWNMFVFLDIKKNWENEY